MKKTLIIFSLILLLNSCDRWDRDISQSFVLAYFQMENENFQVSQLDSASVVMYTKEATMIGNWKSIGKVKKRYTALAEKYGDVSYNREISVYHEHYINPVVDIDIKNIQVVSNNDYDERHPAGSDLSDMIKYIGASPYRFIQNNYAKRTSDPVSERSILYFDNIACYTILSSISEEELLQGYYLIEKRLSDLDIDDLKMIGICSSINYEKEGGIFSFGILEFTQPPTLEKTHTLKVTMNLLDGTKAEDTVVMNF